MNETKSLFMSKTVITAILTIVAVGLSFFGIDFSDAAQAEAATQIMALESVVGSLLALFFRVAATKKIKITTLPGASIISIFLGGILCLTVATFSFAGCVKFKAPTPERAALVAGTLASVYPQIYGLFEDPAGGDFSVTAIAPE